MPDPTPTLSPLADPPLNRTPRSRIRAQSALSQDQLDAILAKHRVYLEEGGEPGEQAYLCGLFLHGLTFAGNLARVQFQRATLRECTFEADADLREADFSGADLERLDLSKVRNLSDQRFGAAILTDVKLPPGFLIDGLGQVRDLATRAERILLTLLATCATVVVLTFVIPHEHLFQASRAITLPVLSVQVPIRTFYVLAPWLLLVPYTYLLSTLLKLWTGQRGLPMVSTSNRASFRELGSSPNFSAMPFGTVWPLAQGNHPTVEEARAQWIPSTRAERILVGLLVWLVVPATVLWLWLSYLPRHSLAETVSQLLALTAAVAFSIAAYGKMMAHFRAGMEMKPPDPTFGWGPRRFLLWARTADGYLILRYEPPPPNAPHQKAERLAYARIAALTGATLVLGLAVSAAGIYTRGCVDDPARFAESSGRCHRLSADLRDAELASLRLNRQNLRRAYMPGARLNGAYLERALLEGAQLSGATLVEADLKDAHLERAVLWEADLRDARLKEAHLEHADLRGARLAGAALQGVHLQHANLRGADLTGAVLCGVDLRGARLGTATSLAAAWGAEFATFSAPPAFVPRERLPRGTPPRYLTPEEQQEYRKWLAADDGLGRVRRQITAALQGRGVLNRAALVSAIEDIDVSMGASTQRLQIGLVRWLRRQPRTGYGPATLAYTPSVRKRIRDFEEKVQEKATNHCVPSEGKLPPAG
ncbi:MAG TPA: pentapeptide repeat-containing protein [Longimicrobium sp.]|nr:pentapeptide repeat-containing protein [Longimicrobium sp.]